MAFLRYTLLRVLLFVVVAALLWIAGLRDLWLVMFAILGSGVVSIFVLTKSRDAASESLANRLAEIKRRRDQRTAAEDAWNDQVRAEPSEPTRPAAVEADESGDVSRPGE